MNVTKLLIFLTDKTSMCDKQGIQDRHRFHSVKWICAHDLQVAAQNWTRAALRQVASELVFALYKQSGILLNLGA